MNTVAGLDPGVNGGLAVINDCHQLIRFQGFKDFTNLDLFRFLVEIRATYIPDKWYLEKVHARPQDKRSLRNLWTMAENYGKLKMALTALAAPMEEVQPQKWQMRLSLGAQMDYDKRKKAHKQKAEELFPNARITLPVADAILIAEYGYRENREVLPF